MSEIKYLFFSFLAVAWSIHVSAATPQSIRPVPTDFVDVSVKELMGQQLLVDIPIQLKLPVVFSSHSTSPNTTVWASSSDWALVKSGRESERRDGYVVAQMSPNFGFDKSSGVFSDFKGTTELNLAEKLNSMGFRDVVVQTIKVGGYPLMLVQSTLIGGRLSFAIYLATLIDTNTIFIYYSPPEYCGRADEVVWNSLVSSAFAMAKSGLGVAPVFRCPGTAEHPIRMPTGTSAQQCLSLADPIALIVRLRGSFPNADSAKRSALAEIVGARFEMDPKEVTRILDAAYSNPKLDETSIGAYEVGVRCRHQINAKPIPPLSRYAIGFEQCQAASDDKSKGECYAKVTRLE